MGKYLRHILSNDDEPAVAAVLGDNTAHLAWMYEHYATPYSTGGIQKLYVGFTADATAVGPPEEFLGILTVWEFFNVAAYPRLAGAEQQRYYLDRLHAGVIRCARTLDWDAEHFAAARDRMLAAGLQFAFWWKKPLSSPDRKLKVQGRVEAGPRTHVWLVFSDRAGQEIRRCLLAEIATGSCDLRHIFGRIEWLDNITVRITQNNDRDYWICKADGGIEFHYPRAERGDPHGEYDLGRKYFDGGLQHFGRDRGLALIRSAAAKGYKHAVMFLNRLRPEGDGALGEPSDD